MIKLDILSDPICPWCYIGKANLDRALAEAPRSSVRDRVASVPVEPGHAAEGMDRQAYLDAKFGGRDQADAVYGRIAEAAVAAGLNLKLVRNPAHAQYD